MAILFKKKGSKAVTKPGKSVKVSSKDKKDTSKHVKGCGCGCKS